MSFKCPKYQRFQRMEGLTVSPNCFHGHKTAGSTENPFFDVWSCGHTEGRLVE